MAAHAIMAELPSSGELVWRDLVAGYGRVPVVRAGTIRPLVSGTLNALLGPNGAGKSTLLKTVAGLLKPQEGSLLWRNEPLQGVADRREGRVLAYMPQALPPRVRLTVLEAVQVAWRLGTRIASAPRTTDNVVIPALLEELGLSGLAMQSLDTLSGGQRQLVGLAQALVRQPRILLLDEPLAALDLRHRYLVMEHLQRATRARGLVTVMAVHDIDLALQVADQVLVLAHGRLLAQGHPAEVVSSQMLAEVYGVRATLDTDREGRPMVRVEGALE